jgi:hypothetical protein
VSLSRPEHPARVAVVVVIAVVAVNAAIFGALAQRNGPATKQRPQAIQDLFPQESELQVPQQAVGADLIDTYTGQLILDGHVIPQDQITGDPTLGQVIFEPGPDKDLRELRKGTHNAVIEYWPKEIRDADQARAKKLLGSYSWSFEVG